MKRNGFKQEILQAVKMECDEVMSYLKTRKEETVWK